MSSSSAVTFSLSLYSDLRVVKTGGQPLLKFILRYLSRHSLNLSPMEKYGEWEKTRHFKSTSTTQFTLCLKNDYKIQKWSKKQELGILKEGIQMLANSFNPQLHIEMLTEVTVLVERRLIIGHT